MSVDQPRRRVCIGVLCVVAAYQPSSAQLIGSLDVGVSSVRYDGFLPSGAASLTPSFTMQGARSTVNARVTYLRFESGNFSVQGSAAGSLFLPPPASRWRAEVWGTAGGSRYPDFASFWHALGGVRLHRMGRGASFWLDANGGRASFGQAPRPVLAVAGGMWRRTLGGAGTVTLSASHTRVGDTVYTDVGTLARARYGRLEAEAALAARVLSRGGGRGVFGEASAAYEVSSRLALVLAGGRYPTDPIRGSIAGRYLMAALRIRTLLPRRPALPKPPPTPAVFMAAGANGVTAPAAALELERLDNGRVRFVVLAPDGAPVELAGDFTDWQPVALARTAAARWEATLAVSRGVHRINIRMGRGPWMVPAGTTPTFDDYGGESGIFVVP